ncbi:unnamed protein product [Mesocestoides corti]|uniref:CRM1_C domain-containing protein n=1 Tax=Mesocestoides corti TaxID=53468 RepID=A0A0R3UDQ7_MESCO|nr:unnamed protein product [Mesocestoides corti]
MAAVVNGLGDSVLHSFPGILHTVLQCTLEMISEGEDVFTELHSNFFILLQAISSYAFPALLTLQTAEIKAILNSVIRATKHSTPQVSNQIYS